MKFRFKEFLLPRPRKIRIFGGSLRLAEKRRLIVSLPKGCLSEWKSFRDLVQFILGKSYTRLVRWNFPARIKRTKPQEYSLSVRREHILISASDRAGLRYALTTLQQLMSSGERIPAMKIHDWPDFPVRGVMLDISRDKVPTIATLRELIRKFAHWKLNQLQLYTEHTFAYRGHEEVWRGASPMTPVQIRTLDRYCARHGIELVPNQNSFGHMERWLKLRPYRALAETSGPWRLKSGVIRTEPATLNPLDPRSIRLISNLYDQLLPSFSSKLFNVGCDETFELGQGKSQKACRRRGLGNVYVDYLLKIHREVRRRGRTMMFWSDIIHEHPETIRRLPKDAVALVWGYEADHPFAKQCAEMRRAGLSFYVCPGTSSWCSFAGRTENCMANLRNAASAGLRSGANGYLITDWGDYGHRQYLPASYAGFIYGAAIAWCAESNWQLDIVNALARFGLATHSNEWARLWLEIGRVPEMCGMRLKNRTILFSMMENTLENMPSLSKVSMRSIKKLQKWLLSFAMQAIRLRDGLSSGALLEADEFLNTLRVLCHATSRYELATAIAQGRILARDRDAFALDMSSIMREHRRLWLARNRAGGLESSLGYYERNLRELRKLAGPTRSTGRRRNSISTME